MNEETLAVLMETINIEYEDHKRNQSEESLVRVLEASGLLTRHLTMRINIERSNRSIDKWKGKNEII